MESMETLPKVQINPRLAASIGIEGQQNSGSAIKLSVFQSDYTEIVHRNRQYIPNEYPENKQRLTCRVCGKRGKYDLGMIAVNPELFQIENPFAHSGNEEEDLGQASLNLNDYIQFTGYFRCKHCNGGEWSFGNDFMLFIMAFILQHGVTDDDDKLVVQLGHLQSFDGHEPKSATDAEDHLLDLIAKKPDDAFLWSRLGNVYRHGGAPELAVVAFEQSLRCDSAQVESHASLANILYHVGEFEACIRHSHMAIAHARFYKKLEFTGLHEMACVLFRNLLDASMALDNTDLFLPPRELMEAAALQHGKPVAKPEGVLDLRSFDLYLDDIDSFASLADIYVGPLGRTRKQTRLRHPKKKKKQKR